MHRNYDYQDSASSTLRWKLASSQWPLWTFQSGKIFRFGIHSPEVATIIKTTSPNTLEEPFALLLCWFRSRWQSHLIIGLVLSYPSRQYITVYWRHIPVAVKQNILIRRLLSKSAFRWTIMPTLFRIGHSEGLGTTGIPHCTRFNETQRKYMVSLFYRDSDDIQSVEPTHVSSEVLLPYTITQISTRRWIQSMTYHGLQNNLRRGWSYILTSAAIAGRHMFKKRTWFFSSRQHQH